MPACRRLYPNNDFFYLPDGASSHTSGVAQQHLRKELGRRFLDKFSWSPSSADCSPLDDYIWNTVKQELYSGQCAPSKDLEELKKRSKMFSAAAVKSKC